ncbi:MAB_1171c family putative transporter [Streptomyces sp. NPDC090022]|uniref:MAB_1171c family putative transporter n=1 Tax=Streptomyces sp. NPDC090022 TaxID=3365920 RepID=UPI00381E854A
MNEDLTFYAMGLVLLTAFVLKVPALLRNWNDMLQRTVCALLFVASLVFFTASPPSIAAVNRWTGIPNVAAPLVYCVLSSFSGCCLVLLIQWRGNRDERVTRRQVRFCIAAYAAVNVALIALFVLADASEERLRDLDTFYANTPYMREMIVLYLLAHMVAALTMTVLCARWSVRVRGSLRAGLVIIVVGYLLNIGYDIVKFSAVGARWAGHDWDDLSTVVAPDLASTSALLVGIGFMTPLVGQRLGDRWRSLRQYRRLAFLWREMRAVGDGQPHALPGGWTPLDMRIIQRVRDIHDGILALAPYYDLGLRERTHAAALGQGRTPDEADAVADAAMLAAAGELRRTCGADGPPRSGDTQVVVSSRTSAGLVLMSQALAHSPLVAAARRGAALTESRPS